jgi:hypothetical protein
MLAGISACSASVSELFDGAIEHMLSNPLLTDDNEVSPPPEPPPPEPSAPPDLTPAEAFISRMDEIYGITLTDENDYLSGGGGAMLMDEIESCLELFTAEFVKSLTSMYAVRGSDFHIRLDEPDDTEHGSIVWNDDLVIRLRYDEDTGMNGVHAATLAHELGHAVHRIVSVIIGDEQIETALTEINGDFEYLGSLHGSGWDAEIHGNAFAYSYGMFNHHEDIATLFELLVSHPDEMRVRLSDPAADILRAKTEYLRYLTSHISGSTGDLFAPLDQAGIPAAA